MATPFLKFGAWRLCCHCKFVEERIDDRVPCLPLWERWQKSLIFVGGSVASIVVHSPCDSLRAGLRPVARLHTHKGHRWLCGCTCFSSVSFKRMFQLFIHFCFVSSIIIWSALSAPSSANRYILPAYLSVAGLSFWQRPARCRLHDQCPHLL